MTMGSDEQAAPSGTPTPEPGDFEAEVSGVAPDAGADGAEWDSQGPDERHGERGTAGDHGLLRPRLSRQGRAIRLGTAVGAVLLALVIVLGGVPAARDAAQGWLSRFVPTPTAETFTRAEITIQPEPPAVWAELEGHPLRLPSLAAGAACPGTPASAFSPEYGIGQGIGHEGSSQVYLVAPGAANGQLRYVPGGVFSAASDWGGASVLWAIRLDYGGPIIVRGRQIDGPGQLRFNGGVDEPQTAPLLPDEPLLPELRLVAHQNLEGVPWSGQIALTRLRAPGCYAYQIDGLTFSGVIVFLALPAA
jgi:hypothetical protein